MVWNEVLGDDESLEHERNLTDEKKKSMLAKLEMLEDLANYIDCLREGYTRTLKINNVDNDGNIKSIKIEKY